MGTRQRGPVLQCAEASRVQGPGELLHGPGARKDFDGGLGNTAGQRAYFLVKVGNVDCLGYRRRHGWDCIGPGRNS
ncbi:hypothetical protein GCM10023063_09680 [Arthrobacter methylotrophus]